jgi:chromosome condensin MukBEF complex kleisin-like MukF subunit
MPKNSSGIPALRERLRKLATEHGLEELNDIADQMYRRAHTRRAPTRSPKLTPELAQQIRDYAAAHPMAHHQDIAEHFGVNHGRVSEALNNEV